MEYIYLDCENIAPRSLDALGEAQLAYLFISEKQKKIDLELSESIHIRGETAKVIRISGEGNNALDFHIAYYLGAHAHADPKASFTIVSKDKGFDPLVKHMGAAGLKCVRMERMPVAHAVRSGLGKRTVEFMAHLHGLAAKTRPKKPARLKAYIRHWLGKDGALAEDVYEEVRAADGLSDADGKLIYTL